MADGVMIFIDGTNFLIELAKEILAKEINKKFRPEKPPEYAIKLSNELFRVHANHFPSWQVIRRYWFGSYKGSEEYRNQLRLLLRDCNFEPVLFKRRRGREKEKGVDIALAKAMLVNAFNQNYDIGYLVAGDEDYVGLVDEAKRYGPRVYGAFFEKHGLADELRISFDIFYRLEDRLRDRGVAPHLNVFVRKIEDEIQKGK